MDKEQMLDVFAEEMVDAVCRLRVGSGLTTNEVLQALERVKALIEFYNIAELTEQRWRRNER